MDKKEIDLIVLWRAVWAKRKRLLLYGLLGLGVGMVVAVSIPQQYAATIKLAIEDSPKSRSGSMGALAGMMGLNVDAAGGVDGINSDIYPEIIASTPFLMELADLRFAFEGDSITVAEFILEHQKKPWWSHVLSAPSTLWGAMFAQPDTTTVRFNRDKQQAFRYVLASKIVAGPDKKTGVYTVVVTTQNRAATTVLSEHMVDVLQDYMTRYKTGKARLDLEGKQKMYAEAKQAYYAADSLYALAVDRNRNLISESARIKLERLKNEQTLAYSIYQQLATQVETAKLKLQEDTPIATVIEPVYTPHQPVSPNKTMIIVGFMLVFVLVGAGVYVVKAIK